MYRVRWPNTWEPEANVLGCYALNCFLKNIEIDGNDLSNIPQDDHDGEQWEVHKILDKSVRNGQVKIARIFHLYQIFSHDGIN